MIRQRHGSESRSWLSGYGLRLEECRTAEMAKWAAITLLGLVTNTGRDVQRNPVGREDGFLLRSVVGRTAAQGRCLQSSICSVRDPTCGANGEVTEKEKGAYKIFLPILGLY